MPTKAAAGQSRMPPTSVKVPVLTAMPANTSEAEPNPRPQTAIPSQTRRRTPNIQPTEE